MTVQAGANTGNVRSTTITVSGGGITRTVTVNQNAASIGYNYYLSIDNNSIAASGDGKTVNFKLSSYRIKTINGAETGGKENVSWSSSISGNRVSVSPTSGAGGENAQVQISVGINPTEVARSASVTFTQSLSSKTVSVGIIQQASDLNLNGSYNGQATTIGSSSFSADVNGSSNDWSFESTSAFEISDVSGEKFNVDFLRFNFTVLNGIVTGISNVQSGGDLPLDDETLKLNNGLKAINGQIGFNFGIPNYNIPNCLVSLIRK